MIDFDIRPTDKNPLELINSVEHVRRQHDSLTLINMMTTISGQEAKVWGDDIIGFGQYHYVYKTGRTGIWPILSFTPSVKNISIYVIPGMSKYESMIEEIGRVKHTVNALILHKFSDISLPALDSLLKKVFADIQKSHECT